MGISLSGNRACTSCARGELSAADGGRRRTRQWPAASGLRAGYRARERRSRGARDARGSRGEGGSARLSFQPAQELYERRAVAHLRTPRLPRLLPHPCLPIARAQPTAPAVAGHAVPRRMHRVRKAGAAAEQRTAPTLSARRRPPLRAARSRRQRSIAAAADGSSPHAPGRAASAPGRLREGWNGPGAYVRIPHPRNLRRVLARL